MNSNKLIFRTKPYLAAACIAHCAQAVLQFTGLQYHTQAARRVIWEGFPALVWADRAAGILLLAAAFLQFLAMLKTPKRARASDGLSIAAYILLLITTAAIAAARFIITALSPFTLSTVLQLLLYILLLIVRIRCREPHGTMEAGNNNEERQHSVCSDPVLQGGSGSSGNSEGSEGKNDGPDQKTADLAEEPGLVCQ